MQHEGAEAVVAAEDHGQGIRAAHESLAVARAEDLADARRFAGAHLHAMMCRARTVLVVDHPPLHAERSFQALLEAARLVEPGLVTTLVPATEISWRTLVLAA